MDRGIREGTDDGQRHQRKAERADDLAFRVGRGKGQHDAPQRPAEQPGADRVGAAQDGPGVPKDQDERGGGQDEPDDADRRHQARSARPERHERATQAHAAGQEIGCPERQAEDGEGRPHNYSTYAARSPPGSHLPTRGGAGTKAPPAHARDQQRQDDSTKSVEPEDCPPVGDGEDEGAQDGAQDGAELLDSADDPQREAVAVLRSERRDDGQRGRDQAAATDALDDAAGD